VRAAAACLAVGVIGAAMLGAPASARADVSVLSTSATFYHFGAAVVDGDLVAFVQEPGTTSPISFDDGLLSFSASSELLPQITTGGSSIGLTLGAVHTVAAAVHPSAENGYTEAGAGLSEFTLNLRITDLPVIYTGDITLEVFDGLDSFPSGSIIPPGDYSFRHFLGPFDIHAHVTAVTGENRTVTGGLAFEFQFTTIPAPGVLAPALGLAAAAVHRRRCGSRAS